MLAKRRLEQARPPWKKCLRLEFLLLIQEPAQLFICLIITTDEEKDAAANLMFQASHRQ